MMSRRFRVSCPHQPARRIEGSVSTPGAGEIGPSKSLARWFRPGVVIATELRQRRRHRVPEAQVLRRV